MCLKKVKKTKRVQKGPKMKKRNEFRLTQQNGICGIHFEKFWFGSKENKFLKIPTLIRMYPKHVRKMGNRTRNFGISNALILTKIKFPKIFEDAAADILKAIDIKKIFDAILFISRDDKAKTRGSRSIVGQSKNDKMSDIWNFVGHQPFSRARFWYGPYHRWWKMFFELGIKFYLKSGYFEIVDIS